MSSMSTWRQRRQTARTRRAVERAVFSASPALRDELLTIANGR
jgi:hypothetical protein